MLIVALAVSATSAKKNKASLGSDERQHAVHALNRLTFGPRPGDVERVMSMGVDKWIEQQLHPEKISDSALDQRLAGLRTLKMSTQTMLEDFPPQPVIKAVADGRMPMPGDPLKRAIYQAQLEQYRLRLEKKAAQQDDQAAADTPDSESRREARREAVEAAARITSLPADKRMEEILKLGPMGRRALVTGLAPAERLKLLGSLTPEQRETLVALVNPALVVSSELQEGKLLRAIYSERQLDEVMTDFWFNHFNVFIGKGADRYLITSYERDVIRPHALGKFKDLLLATARSPAMLFYLDNWMSVGPNSDAANGIRERRPPRPRMRRRFPPNVPPAQPARQPRRLERRGLNENYARELMELHTVGVNGGYTQRDVTEVARILTGWTIKQPRMAAEFDFNPRMHEPGEKIVMGHKFKDRGEGEGKQLLDFLASRPATARFISTKLAQRFVSDDPPPALIERMAATFQKSDGDIREVLRTMFRSPEFWAPEAYRAKVKTPLEFVVSAMRASGAGVENAIPLIQVLSRMGMPLYGAQAPNGYAAKADTWVNSAALLDRMNFSLAFAAGRLPGIKVDVQVLGDSAASDETALNTLEEALVAGGVAQHTHETILKQLADPQSGEAQKVNVITGLLLGSPEFQRR